MYCVTKGLHNSIPYCHFLLKTFRTDSCLHRVLQRCTATFQHVQSLVEKDGTVGTWWTGYMVSNTTTTKEDNISITYLKINLYNVITLILVKTQRGCIFYLPWIAICVLIFNWSSFCFLNVIPFFVKPFHHPCVLLIFSYSDYGLFHFLWMNLIYEKVDCREHNFLSLIQNESSKSKYFWAPGTMVDSNSIWNI